MSRRMACLYGIAVGMLASGTWEATRSVWLAVGVGLAGLWHLVDRSSRDGKDAL